VMKSIRERALPGAAAPMTAMATAGQDPVVKARARVAEVAAPR
jgi:hypothetical protein